MDQRKKTTWQINSEWQQMLKSFSVCRNIIHAGQLQLFSSYNYFSIDVKLKIPSVSFSLILTAKRKRAWASMMEKVMKEGMSENDKKNGIVFAGDSFFLSACCCYCRCVSLSS